MYVRFTFDGKTYEFHHRGLPRDFEFSRKSFRNEAEMRQFVDACLRSDSMAETKLASFVGTSVESNLADRVVKALQAGRIQVSGRGEIPVMPFNPKPRVKEPEYVPEPARSVTEEKPNLDYKIVVEVAGICQDMNQVVVYGNRQEGLTELMEGAVPYKKDGTLHRSLVTIGNIPNKPRQLGLRIVMHKANAGTTEPPLYLPFADNVQPVLKDTEKDEWDNVIIPVKPLGYITENKRRQESDILSQGGWVYIFKGSELWRELQVYNHQTYRDTRLHYYRSMRTNKFAADDPEHREALGSAYHTIWLPYKANGAVISGYKMMYSRKPLTWEQIDQLEANPVALEKRTTPVDGVAIYGSSKNFDLNDGPIGPVAPALLDQVKELVPPPDNPRKAHPNYLDEHREHKFPVVYLDAVDRTLRLHFELDCHAPEDRNYYFTLRKSDNSWEHSLKIEQKKSALVEGGNNEWVELVFEDVPPGGNFDLIQDQEEDGKLPFYVFSDRSYESLLVKNLQSEKSEQIN
ncbi:hypothetical protein [Spartinivicinus ruber]|uniref:hypothetical protein n=1 Tax=Spartinivicinus ruber TaxID=2683272 RepID=UPI0013D21EA7|nr:hypothetical protein [Spartinivicinus ruber]